MAVSRNAVCWRSVLALKTHSPGMFNQVKKNVTLDVFVMIRPRGADFCYHPMELEVMKEDIRLFKEANADGIVLGALTPYVNLSFVIIFFSAADCLSQYKVSDNDGIYHIWLCFLRWRSFDIVEVVQKKILLPLTSLSHKWAYAFIEIIRPWGQKHEKILQQAGHRLGFVQTCWRLCVCWLCSSKRRNASWFWTKPVGVLFVEVCIRGSNLCTMKLGSCVG